MRNFLRVVAATSAIALLPFATSAGAQAQTASRNYIVQYAPTASQSNAEAAIANAGGRIRQSFKHALRGAVVSLTDKQAVSLARDGRVRSVELDGVARISDTQSGPTWGLDRIDQRNLPLSASYTYANSGSGVTAYVVDTGVRADHVELAGRVGAGYSAISDGNGTADCNGHGTHVAGTIGSTSYGVAKAVTIVPVRVLDCAGSGSYSGIIAGIDWIIAQHVAGVPAVANMSLGGGASSSLDTAVANLAADGVSVVVAAGNSNVDACTTSPARAAAAITVGATTSSDARASYSNFGSCLDLFAPGSSITSTYHTSSTATAVLSGTSMASPHVAGVAALVLAANPTFSPESVASMIVADSTPNIVSSVGTNSPNRLLFANPTGFSSTPASAPSAPTAVKAVAGKRSATVSWVQGPNGGSALTGQSVKVYAAGKLVGTVAVAASATSVKIGSLSAGVAYTFSVNARNAIGVSADSALSNTVYPTR